jgi:hypothetical protein
MTRRRAALLLLAATAGCYGARPSSRIAGTGGHGGGQAGTGGGAGGTAGAGNAGTSGGPGLGGTAASATTGASGTTGGATGGAAGQSGAGSGGGTGAAGGGTGATGGSGPAVVGGPCVVTPDQNSAEVFGRATDGFIYRRAFDGRNWGPWAPLAGLDGSMIDARSDLDCGASIDTIHIVATGTSPPGALLHAFGFGTSYNTFRRELAPLLVSQSPSVGLLTDDDLYLSWASRAQPADLYDLPAGMAATRYSPITSLTDDLVSGSDVSLQSNSVLVAAFDSQNRLAIYPFSRSGTSWLDPFKLESPAQTFAFNPAICADNGFSGSFSIDVAAVTGHDLWFASTPRIPNGPIQFSSWTMINDDAGSSPDCAILRANPNLDAIIHVVTLSSSGTILDIQGNGTSWATTELGYPR